MTGIGFHRKNISSKFTNKVTFDQLCRNKNCKTLTLWITRAFSCNELEVWRQYTKMKNISSYEKPFVLRT